MYLARQIQRLERRIDLEGGGLVGPVQEMRICTDADVRVICGLVVGPGGVSMKIVDQVFFPKFKSYKHSPGCTRAMMRNLETVSFATRRRRLL